jgi:hypothetical protein|tara:strand:- start:221 stop:1066 length:846 start_codon:yes stop_codon:yes gene_type:complete
MPKGRKKKHAAPRYVSNADELANRNGAFSKDQQDRQARRKAAGCDEDELSNKTSMLDLASSGLGRGGEGGAGGGDEAPREKKEKKPKGIAAIIGLETESLNGKKKKNTLSKKDAADGKFEKAQLSRREKEILDAESAQRRHYKLTKEGKTDESKKDMERLKKMRASRDKKKKKREAELAKAEAIAEQEALAAKRAVQEAGSSKPSVELEKPSKIAIKKMKPAQLKEHLKDRGESAQGSKKDLVTRLLKVRFFVLRFTMNQILNAVLNIHVDTEYYVFMIYD